MAFIPIFMMSIAFLFFVISVFVILLIIKKIGMTLLAGKLGIRKYGRLWIPGLGALYEAKMMNTFLEYGKSFEAVYFTVSTIIKLAWLICFFFGPEYNEASFDTINSIISDTGFIIFLIDAVLKSIILKKNGYKAFVSVIISILLPSFWYYFANAKTKKI